MSEWSPLPFAGLRGSQANPIFRIKAKLSFINLFFGKVKMTKKSLLDLEVSIPSDRSSLDKGRHRIGIISVMLPPTEDLHS